MKRTILPSAAIAGALLLAACGSTNDSGSKAGHGAMTSSMPGMNASASAAAASTPVAGPHNGADVGFATNMIPHHAQAVYMAQLAERHATTSTLKSLAGKVRAAQSPEIEQMSGWLARWKQPIPSSSYTPGAMGGMSMSGMMSDRDMRMLGEAHGISFDRMWLTMMISHHQGAIAMARTELAEGQNSAAKLLAHDIASAQTAEIATMRRMLAKLPS